MHGSQIGPAARPIAKRCDFVTRLASSFWPVAPLSQINLLPPEVRRGRPKRGVRFGTPFQLICFNPVQSSRSLSHLAGEALHSMSLLTAELINEIELDRAAALDRVIATELENRALKRRLSELEERSPFVPADRH